MKLSAIAGVAAIAMASLFSTHLSPDATGPGDTVVDMQAAYSAVISADVASTVPMPDGSVMWLTGDAGMINGQVVWDPHSEFVSQAAPGSDVFTVLKSTGGDGYPAGQWQQVPNWSDGTVFWMAAGAVDNGVLHVFGARINLSNLATVGYYDATFDATTLAYQGITQIPAGVSAVAQGTGGWWLIGTDRTSTCSQQLMDCYSAHSMWASTGSLGNYASWTAPYTFLTATGHNLGGVVDLYRTSAGLWTAWTKTNDIMGSTIEEFTAPHLEVGPWTFKSTWPITTTCGPGTPEGNCTSGWAHPNPTTYGVRVHPAQGQPAGDLLVTVIENDANAFPPTNGAYDPIFQSLPTG